VLGQVAHLPLIALGRIIIRQLILSKGRFLLINLLREVVVGVDLLLLVGLAWLLGVVRVVLVQLGVVGHLLLRVELLQ